MLYKCFVFAGIDLFGSNENPGDHKIMRCIIIHITVILSNVDILSKFKDFQVSFAKYAKYPIFQALQGFE